MKQYTPYIIILIIAIVIVVVWFFLADKVKALFAKPTATATGTGTATPNPTQPVILDHTKVLKKGVYNSPEVEELQSRLGGLTIDGDFGAQTEAKLLEKKCVKEITLANYYNVKCTDWSGETEDDKPFSLTDWLFQPVF